MLGDHFYARVHSFDVSCPACGHFIRSNAPGAKGAYSASIARLQCPRCERPFIIGLVCWPIATGGDPKQRPTRPADQQPGPRERLALRNMGGGWWPETALKRHRAKSSNATGDEDAACDCPTQGPPSMSCALHT